MTDALDALILDLLEWMAPCPRPYLEVISVWRTSCPRLPVWEEANDRGFIARRAQDEGGALVLLTPAGREFLDRHRRAAGRGPVAREQRFVFDEVAELYARARPSYPQELIEDLIREADLRPGARVRTHSDHRLLPADRLQGLLEAVRAAIDAQGGRLGVDYVSVLCWARRV